MLRKIIGLKGILASSLILFSSVSLGALAEKSIEANLHLGLYADIIGLESFDLKESKSDDKGVYYEGRTGYKLVSNGQVRVSLKTSNLVYKDDVLETSYTLDGKEELSFDTAAEKEHNDSHFITASTFIAKEKQPEKMSGHYKSQLTLVVSGL